MAGLFDDADMDLVCPNCGHKFKQTVGWLKNHPTFVCPKCSVGRFDAAELVRSFKDVDKSVDEFKRKLDDLNRKLKF